VHLDAPPSAGPGDGGSGGAIAGAGCARVWRGAPAAPFDAPAAARVRRFVSTGAPRTRALGGARFDASSAPAPEWSAFGAYFFLLPALELSEGPHAALLALTLAWDDGLAAPVPQARAAPAGVRSARADALPQDVETGARSVAEAVASARAALAAAAAAAPVSSDARVDALSGGVITAALLPPLVASVAHTPDERAWTTTVEQLLRGLSSAAEAVQPVRLC
jgi:hypothetical protein